MDGFHYFDNKFNKKEVICLKLLLIILIFIILGTSMIFYTKKTVADVAFAKSYILLNANTNEVLLGENINEKLPMASTTKIMTALLAVENLDMNKIYKIPKEAIGVEGSSIYLKEGESYVGKDLVYGLMMQSGNDAAKAISILVSGSENEFVNLMNEKAKSLNLVNTHFMNPHGLHDENHYTSSYDLARLTSYALKNNMFKNIVSTKSYKLETENNQQKYFFNKNKMLKFYDGANGVKTGFTKVAGRCLVSSARKNGIQLVAVVLGCPNMWADSISLLDYGFSKYQNVKVLKKDDIVFNRDKYKLALSEDLVIESKYNDIDLVIKLDNFDKFPINMGENIGEMEVYSQNKLLFSKKIYTINLINNKEELAFLKELIVLNERKN